MARIEPMIEPMIEPEPMVALDARDLDLLGVYRDHEGPPSGAYARVYEGVLERVEPVPAPVPWLRSAAVSFAIAASVLLAIRGVTLGARAARSEAEPASAMQAPMVGTPAAADGEATARAPEPTPAPNKRAATARTPEQTPAPEEVPAVAADAPVQPAAPAKPRARKVVASADELAEDMRLLEQARRTEDPTTRLGLLREHAKAHGSSKFAEEREMMTIEALCTVGKSDDARTRARSFHRRWAKSAFAARISRSCAEAK